MRSHCAEAVGVLKVQEAPVAPFAEGTATSSAPASDNTATGVIQLRSLRIAIDTSFASEAQRLSEGSTSLREVALGVNRFVRLSRT
ncbi:unannotated protein [freshwater metagenome]|uniref:Unannotated protein n=1 Tax=freshwater metagenome TaxID=449393 RepID=A0A6J6QBM2_9ZZZZ